MMGSDSLPTTISKPAGIPVFPPHDDVAGDCLLRRLLAQQPWRAEIDWPKGFEGGIAHRLDTSTSGAMLLADSVEELEKIRSHFRDHSFVKTYLFLSAGDVPWDRNTCDKPIAHDPRKKGRMIVQRGKNTPHRGKWYPAQTRFERIGGRLWRATMRSGVTHQIRAHAAFVGIAILGDYRYGGGPTPPDAPPGLSFFLHHLGLRGPNGLVTDPVAKPEWAA